VADKSKPELQYQIGSSPVTRGQIRLLLLLMLIQVVMTAQSIYAPGVVAWAKGAWAEHQQAVAHRAQVKKNLADLQRCLAFTQPADKVVWDEDPGRAAKLLAGGGYRPVTPDASDFFSDAVPPVAAAARPPTIPKPVLDGSMAPGAGASEAIAFLHGRRAGQQPERLVVVGISGPLSTTEPNGTHQASETFDGDLWKWQTIDARSYGTSGVDGLPTSDGPSETSLKLQQDAEPTQMRAHWAAATQPGNPGELTIQYHDQLRVYAAQPDPADASHFTMAYDLDGKPGVIDGWLKPDGSVVLKPPVGKLVNSVWYPNAN